MLLHPTSLPGPYGIGDLGPEAYRFVDWLTRAKQSVWQVLPLGPTGMDNSPYAAASAFAGNPLLIHVGGESTTGPVDYDAVARDKLSLLRAEAERFTETEALERFAAEHADALKHNAYFQTAKVVFENKPWWEWPEAIRRRDEAAMRDFHLANRTELGFQGYLQMKFFEQWHALKSYANARGIRIMGDLPIFVAPDSADVWANPELFRLDAGGLPVDVAGVPPDYFSPTGQLWGNPIYRWELMEQDGWQWWSARFRQLLKTVDLARVDHFRGFVEHWSVPAGEPDATRGRWEPGPGAALFRAVEAALGGSLPLIAEDLGTIDDAVLQLRDQLDYPGMKVLHFAFSDPANWYLPHNHPRNCVVYTGTHDNDTTVGWYTAAGEPERHRMRVYTGSDGHGVAWDLIRVALSSVADTAIVPLQDVLELGSEARMNVPGRPAGNWSWRYDPLALSNERADRLAELTYAYGRAPAEQPSS